MEICIQNSASHKNIACMDRVSSVWEVFHRQDSPSALKSNSLPLSELVHWADQRANIANQTRSQSIANQWCLPVTLIHVLCL